MNGKTTTWSRPAAAGHTASAAAMAIGDLGGESWCARDERQPDR
uniref:Uncharacterized protein n=1 Tax=Arundo donax TaxID=35708 RepID=A0A0A8XZS0_ARUDO